MVDPFQLSTLPCYCLSVSKRHLKIIILGLNYAPETTGNAPYTTSLAEGLTAEGHTVRVLAGYPHYPEWNLREGYSGWKQDEFINGVSVTRLRHRIPQTPNALSRLHMELSFGLRLMLAHWHRPDVVLVVSPALFASALAILRVHLSPRRPAVGIWVQDLYSRGIAETGQSKGKLARLATGVESKILRSADGVAAIHDRFKHYMVDSLRVPAHRIEVIRNWTHLPPSPATGLEEIRAKLGWKQDDFVVLHAGNMGKKQGLENVVEAARLGDARDSAVRFVLMGDGNQRRNLESFAAGVASLTFLDALPSLEFQQALAAANLLLVNEMPGIKDMAVPSKLTSYFNAGVPVIAATDEGSVTAFEIESSGGGVRVNAGDPGALLEAVETIAREPASTARMAENALRFREETLSESAAIAKYDVFINSLASSRGH